jgi:hypothetical protein
MAVSATRGPGRYAVRFSGEITKEAARTLRSHHMGLQRRDTFFESPVPYSTTVVVLADNETDAVARVREALYGHGEFVGFEAVGLADQPDDGED